ncbi:MAG: glycosyltransferase [Patescibacteria group bacterium]|nr:glycosyltransferase [Patescibacteria group bacterium]
MRIGIDISQTAYKETGVGKYVESLVHNLLKVDKKNEYILFFSSLRRNLKSQISNLKNTNKKLKIKTFRIPPSLLDILWNKLHILSVEWLIGDVDVFISSDWTEPPTKKAKKATIIYDMIVYKYPRETDSKIVAAQKRKLKWVKKESNIIFCISESTKKDVIEILGIAENKLRVIYPGIKL